MNAETPSPAPVKPPRWSSLLERLRGTRFRFVLPQPGGRDVLRRALGVLAWIVGGGALVGIVFAVSFYLAMRVEMRGSEVLVPDLSGQTLEAAHAMVEQAELVLEVVDRRNDPAVPSERVLQQDPVAGASVKRGRKVKLILSLGDRVLTVPSLVGEASRAVEIELRQEGFVPGFEVHVNAAAPMGEVLAQVPPADSPAVPKSRVHRLVSDGPPRASYVMPDLVGTSRAVVETWARKVGFRVATRSVNADGQPAGIVIGQLPLSGYRVRSNDVIEITVTR